MAHGNMVCCQVSPQLGAHDPSARSAFAVLEITCWWAVVQSAEQAKYAESDQHGEWDAEWIRSYSRAEQQQRSREERGSSGSGGSTGFGGAWDDFFGGAFGRGRQQQVALLLPLHVDKVYGLVRSRDAVRHAAHGNAIQPRNFFIRLWLMLGYGIGDVVMGAMLGLQQQQQQQQRQQRQAPRQRAQPSADPRDPLGHYKYLGIQPSASKQEVQVRCQTLLLHPMFNLHRHLRSSPYMDSSEFDVLWNLNMCRLLSGALLKSIILTSTATPKTRRLPMTSFAS